MTISRRLNPKLYVRSFLKTQASTHACPYTHMHMHTYMCTCTAAHVHNAHEYKHMNAPFCAHLCTHIYI